MYSNTNAGGRNPGFENSAPQVDFRTPALNRVKTLRIRLAGKPTADLVADSRAVLARKTKYETTDPTVLSAAFIVARAEQNDGRFLLRSYRDTWYEWKGGRYVDLNDGDVFTSAWAAAEAFTEEAWFTRGEKKKKKTIGKESIANALEALKARPGVRVPADVQAPCWLTPEGCVSAPGVMTFPNGNLDLERFLAGDADAFTRSTPDLFTLTAFPYEYDPDAKCSTWDRVSLHNFQKAEVLAAWEEVLGVLLTPDASYQKAFALYGPPGCGKSVILAALLALLGRDNVSALGLERFNAEYDLAGTEGKLANVTGDQGEARLNPGAEGQLKQFITGEPTQVNKKYKAPYTLYPTARLVLAANQGLKFSDKSGAMTDRFMIFPLTVRSRGESNQDQRLTSDAFWASEAPGIFNRALDGLRRVRKTGRISEPTECKTAAAQFWQEGDPALQFITKHFRENPDGHVDKQTVYEAYVSYAREHGVKYSLTEATFAKLLWSQFRHVMSEKRLSCQGRPRVYRGIEFVQDGID
jgi:putative DNA primase/helicase